MAYIYRYIDKEDGIVKYIGIVWSDNRNLAQRIYEHSREAKFQGFEWEIEYLEKDISTRTDAEYMEAHYISLFETDKYLNVSKSGWGISKYLPIQEKWTKYTQLKKTNNLTNDAYDLYISDLKNTINILKNGLLEQKELIEIMNEKIKFLEETNELRFSLFEKRCKEHYQKYTEKEFNIHYEKSLFGVPDYTKESDSRAHNCRKTTVNLYSHSELIESRTFYSQKCASMTLNLPMKVFSISRAPRNINKKIHFIYNCLHDTWEEWSENLHNPLNTYDVSITVYDDENFFYKVER